MINAVNVLTQDVQNGINVVFPTTRVLTRGCGCNGWLIVDEASGLFTLTRNGVYEVSFSANINDSYNYQGMDVIGITQDGQVIGGSTMSNGYNGGGSNQFNNVSTTVLVRVSDGNSTIAVRYLGDNQSSSDPQQVRGANIVIKRLA